MSKSLLAPVTNLSVVAIAPLTFLAFTFEPFLLSSLFTASRDFVIA
jgi:hypothetical protein